MIRFSPAAGLALALALSITACDIAESDRLLGPDTPARDIVDIRNSSGRVALLPPINSPYTVDNFDPYTPIRVELCTVTENVQPDMSTWTDAQWLAVEALDCIPAPDPFFAYYERDASSDGGQTLIELQFDANGDPTQYQLGLKTSADMANRVYLVKVLLRDVQTSPAGPVFNWVEHASFNVALFESASATNVPGGRVVGETAGKAFPAKMAVETASNDEIVAVVGCTGTLVHGVSLGFSTPDNFLVECATDPSYQVIAEMQSIDVDPCLPVGWLQDDLCVAFQFYTWDGTTLAPYSTQFAEPVTLIYCYLSAPTGLDMGGYRTPAPYDTFVFPTQNVPNTEWEPDCDALAPGGLAGFFGDVRDALGRLVGLDPAPLYAINRGLGEATGSTSHFGRSFDVEHFKYSGDDQVGVIYSTLPDPLVAQTRQLHHDPQDPVSGATLTFEAIGGGTLTVGTQSGTTVTVTTGTDGFAPPVYWTLGSTVGGQQVAMYGDGVGYIDDDNIFQTHKFWNATGFDIVGFFLPPLGESSGGFGTPYTEKDPTFRVCTYPAGASPCANPVATIVPSQVITDATGRKFWQEGYKFKDSGISSGSYQVQIVLDDAFVAATSVKINVISGGKDEVADGEYYVKATSNIEIKTTLDRVVPTG